MLPLERFDRIQIASVVPKPPRVNSKGDATSWATRTRP